MLHSPIFFLVSSPELMYWILLCVAGCVLPAVSCLPLQKRWSGRFQLKLNWLWRATLKHGEFCPRGARTARGYYSRNRAVWFGCSWSGCESGDLLGYGRTRRIRAGSSLSRSAGWSSAADLPRGRQKHLWETWLVVLTFL